MMAFAFDQEGKLKITYLHTGLREAFYVFKLVDAEGEQVGCHAHCLLKDVCFPLPSPETNENTQLADMKCDTDWFMFSYHNDSIILCSFTFP